MDCYKYWSGLKSALRLRRKKEPGQYTYEPLRDPKRQIRIFTLFPLARGAQLQGRLQTVDFGAEDQPLYETLSYVWGEDPVFDHVVDIDRAQLGITGHLASILTHIRYPKIERALWIDSVCINQANLVEREPGDDDG
jgi:hypothetical protein